MRNAFMLGITLYTPCVALNTVANVPYYLSFLLMTVLGILFTIFVSISESFEKNYLTNLSFTVSIG